MFYGICIVRICGSLQLGYYVDGLHPSFSADHGGAGKTGTGAETGTVFCDTCIVGVCKLLHFHHDLYLSGVLFYSSLFYAERRKTEGIFTVCMVFPAGRVCLDGTAIAGDRRAFCFRVCRRQFPENTGVVFFYYCRAGACGNRHYKLYGK